MRVVQRLQEDMARAYSAVGVDTDRPVVVYGGWAEDNFWGEEARVWWNLHWLNHPHAYILYGGVWAWDISVHEVGSAACLCSPAPEGTL